MLFAIGAPRGLLAVVFVGSGAGLALFDVWWQTALAQRIPAHALSRVSSYDWMGSLALLPLEETGLDLPIELPGYDIGDVTTTLLIDDDGDGHYSKFRIDFDPDA